MLVNRGVFTLCSQLSRLPHAYPDCLGELAHRHLVKSVVSSFVFPSYQDSSSAVGSELARAFVC